MLRSRRRYQVFTAGVVVLAWATVYGIWVANSAPPDPPTTAARVNREMALLLAVPAAVHVVAALLLLHFWLAGVGARLSALDPPGRVLAAAVATLPEHRRGWGMAMVGELAGVRGRPDRWRFALSSAAAAVWPPHSSGWPVLALGTGVVVAATVAAGPAVGAAVPGLGVFAVGFVGLAGALAVLAVARSRRVRFPVPGPTVLVAVGVAAAIAMTVVFLRRDPSAADYLPPAQAVLLAGALAGCLWLAVASPRSLGANRLAPHLGIGAALVYVVGLLLLIRLYYDPDIGHDLVLMLIFQWGPYGLAGACFFAALWAAIASRSFRSGLHAGIWATVATVPLMLALWLHESLRMYATNGGLLLFGDGGPESENLAHALFWSLGFIPAVGLPCAVLGAAAGAYRPSPRIARPQPVEGIIHL